MSEAETNEKPRRRARWFMVMVIVLSALGGALLTKAAGIGVVYYHYSKWKGPVDEARVEKHVLYAVEELSEEVNATPEQKEKLNTIAKTLVADLLPYREKLKSMRTDFHTLIAKEPLERNEIETFRAEKMGLMDEMSKKITTAFADVSDVLNAKQRQKLRNILNDWHH